MSTLLPLVGAPALSWAERLAGVRKLRIAELEEERDRLWAELRVVREEAEMLEEWLRKGGGELR